MAKLFECPCGRKWIVYIGTGDSSTCCKKPMTPVDDGQPMPPTRMELREAFKLFGEDDEPTKH